MRKLALAALLVTSTCWAQESNSQQLPSAVQSPTPAVSEKQTITIPVGTRIPLALAGPVTTKSRPGDSVRAVTGFPVTVGTQLAIPVGAYVEGVIDKVTKGGRSGPSLQMHFTRILFPSGYSLTISGAKTQAKVLSPEVGSGDTSALAAKSGAGNALAAGQSAGFPTVQPPASHMGTIVGVGIGAAAAGVVTMILMAHHNGGSSGVLVDTGWQFEMVLEAPLSVDLASVAGANASGS